MAKQTKSKVVEKSTTPDLTSILERLELLEREKDTIEEVEVGIMLEEGVELPHYQKHWDAGMDICVNADKLSDLKDLQEYQGVFDSMDGKGFILAQHCRVLIPTGIRLDIPIGYEIQIRGRSGKGAKQGLIPSMALGTIDSGYRNEVFIALTNTSNEFQFIKWGERIAQMVLSKKPVMKLKVVGKLSETERGLGGFGSTDK